jgi:hypothetical protein
MIGESTRVLIGSRADHGCEYCKLHEVDDVFTMHVEHIIACKHGGGDEDSNLALACHQCNLHKGSNLSGIDPESGAIVSLFHPRRQSWSDHFRLEVFRIVDISPAGRATVAVLNMNDLDRIHARQLIGVRDFQE